MVEISILQMECPGCNKILELHIRKGFITETHHKGTVKKFGRLTTYYITEPCPYCGMNEQEIKRLLVKHKDGIFAQSELVALNKVPNY